MINKLQEYFAILKNTTQLVSSLELQIINSTYENRIYNTIKKTSKGFIWPKDSRRATKYFCYFI